MREGRIRTQAIGLALCDTVMVLLAMQIAWWLRFDVNAWLGANYGLNPFALGWTPGQPYVMAIFVTLPVFWLILREMNLYSAPEDGAGEFFRLCAGSLFATVLLAAISFYIRVNYEHEQFQYSRAYAILFLPVSVICLSLGRIVFRAVLRGLSRQGIGQNRILFVGAGPLAEELAKALDARGTNRVVGTLSASSKVPLPEDENSAPIVKLSNRILEDAFLQSASEIVIEHGNVKTSQATFELILMDYPELKSGEKPAEAEELQDW
jgi:FlaA1/EpsC-like NDP-sugar epimerase